MRILFVFTKGVIKISVKPPHQMGHVLSDQEEGGKQVVIMVFCSFTIVPITLKYFV
jgi:hypothetical protein